MFLFSLEKKLDQKGEFITYLLNSRIEAKKTFFTQSHVYTKFLNLRYTEKSEAFLPLHILLRVQSSAH